MAVVQQPEIERNFLINEGPDPLLKSIDGDNSMNCRNKSIQDLSDNHIVEILVRLPVKTIVRCKCVCREWLNLITDSHFINLNLAKSPECFVLLHKCSKTLRLNPEYLSLMEIEKENGRNHLHHNRIMCLNLNCAQVFQGTQLSVVGSVNGLICLAGEKYERDKVYICNPITREYMILPKQRHIYSEERITRNYYGFGVSSLTGEYKIIRVFRYFGYSLPELHAEIYTLGTGKWRSIALGHVNYYIRGEKGTFLNNHVHWNIDYRILTFDIDNETFQFLPFPRVSSTEYRYNDRELGVLNGCLCYSLYNRTSREFTIWVMKEYGVNNSWQKEILMYASSDISPILCYTVVSLKDGSILLMYGSRKLLIYHPYTSITRETHYSCVDAISYRPSFLKLQNFKSESVHKFPRHTQVLRNVRL